MTFRTLLLGSATAFVMVGGAQAADLHVAEPVDYLKACSNYGPGWYQTGSGCLKFSGYVRFNTEIVSSGNLTGANGGVGANLYPGPTAGVFAIPAAAATVGGSAATGPYTGTLGPTTNDSHRFQTSADLQVDYAMATEWGRLDARAVILSATSGGQWTAPNAGASLNNNGDGRAFAVDEAWVRLGWFTVGLLGSTYDMSFTTNTALSSSYTLTSPYGRASDSNTDQIRIQIPLSGLVFQFAAEDYRDRADPNFAPSGIPDLIATAEAKIGIMSARAAFGYGTRVGPDTWGVNGALGFDLGKVFAAGDGLTLMAGYSKNGGEWVTDPNNSYSVYGGLAGGAAGGWVNIPGKYWSVSGTFRHYWVPSKFYTAVSAGYINSPVGNGLVGKPWNVAARASYIPTSGLTFTAEVNYFKNAAAYFPGSSGAVGAFFNPAGQWVGILRVQKDLN